MSGTRRATAALCVLGAIALIVFALRFLQRTPAQPPPPVPPRTSVNVILITLDTLRADRLSCYGSKSVETPNFDALAAQGIRFTNAASTVPLTLPAHISMMTGLYPPGHGVRDNVGYAMDAHLPVLAELVHRNGWSTAGFVSAFVLDRRWGIARGFDHYFDDFDLRAMAEASSADVGSVQRDGADTIAAAVRWLDQRPADRPFFLWLHLYDPHEPYAPKEPFRSRYPGRPYDAEVAYTDSLAGDFRRALEERGLFDRSLVIVTSDHGEGLGDHGETTHGFFAYDSTIKAALIVKMPSGNDAGRVVEDAVSHVDLLPTILDVVGLPLPKNVHGRSLVPLLAGKDGGRDRPVYSESLYPLLHYGWAPSRTVRANGFKLIDVPRAELYDLSRDPDEKQNLFERESGRAKELTVALSDLRHDVEKREPAKQERVADEESLARLRSLGYLAGQSGADASDENARKRIDPKDRIQLHEQVTLAQSAMGEREFKTAGKLLEAIVAQDEAIADAQQMLGEIAMEERRPEQAIVRFQRALRLNPKHERSLYGLATAYAALHRHEDAIVGYQYILELDGSDARASLALADLYVGLERFDDAAAVLERAAAKGKASELFVNKLGEVRVQQGRDDEAVALFERAIPPADDFALPHFNLGVIDEKRGNAASARERYERALQIEPQFCRAQFNLGRIHASQGNAELARRLWEASLGSCPGFVQGHYYLAKLLMDQGGDLARAEKLAREGIALDPQHREGPLGHYVLADVLNRTGRVAEARKVMADGRAIQAAMR